MTRKSTQLQIRLRPDQKRRLKQLAREMSMDMSSWVLSRVLPEEAERFHALAAAAERADVGRRRFALAELADFLRALPDGAFQRAVRDAPRARLDPRTLSYIAGAIELAAQRRGQTPPAWTTNVPAAPAPGFGSSLASVRLHLLTRAPVALRRRNLFMDASIDDRV